MFKSINVIICHIVLLCLSVSMLSCEKEGPSVFTPDFSYSFSDEDQNTVRFVNTTEGEHGYMQWNFGNGEQTDKQPANNLTYSIYYPLKGDYEVELKVWGKAGSDDNVKSITKTVSIEKSVLVPEFTCEIMQDFPNYIRLTDISAGDYDTITWSYPGRVFPGSPGEEREIYLAMGGDYNITLEISDGIQTKTISKEISIQADDPGYMEHYELVWSDEFDDVQLNSEEWLHETGDHGWGNGELQNYTDGENTSVSDGSLKITVNREMDGQTVVYTSSRLNSTRSFTYGRMEIRARMPDYKGAGLWPALWMLGESIQEGTEWPLCGEIDIMEYVSWNPGNYSTAIHTESNNHMQGNAITSGFVELTGIEEEFHVFGIIWTYTGIKFYLDSVDNVVLSYKKPNYPDQQNWPFDKPFYFLMNIAVGGNYGGVEGVDEQAFPGIMEVDYVRVFQLR